jgi:hypothetical protein
MHTIFSKLDENNKDKDKDKQTNDVDNTKYSVSIEDCENNQNNEISGTCAYAMNAVDSNKIILSLENILKTIPNYSSSVPNKELQKTHTERRWKFFEIDNRKLIEISQKNPNEDRLYLNSAGQWIKFKMDNCWDHFLIDVKYYYAK